MTLRALLATVTALCLFSAMNLSHAADADRCRAYADRQVAEATRADAKACPDMKPRARDWDGHFNWCLRNPTSRIDAEEERMSARLDGCMSAFLASKTARVPAKADGTIGSYDQRWSKGVQQMANLGMPRPSHPQGFEFEVVSTASKRWSSATVQNQQIGYYGVCDSCKGITARLRDSKGRLIAEQQSNGDTIELDGYPQAPGKGSIEIIVTNCQTRNDRCRMRIASFSR